MLDDDKITSHMRVVTIRVAGALAERLVTTDAATGRPINTDPSATRLIEAVGHKLEHLANARGRRYVSGSPAFSGELPVHIEFIRAGARDAYWVADTLAGHAAGHEAL
jgi:hypothetical protein